MLNLLDLWLFGKYLDQEIRDAEAALAGLHMPSENINKYLNELKGTRERLTQTTEALINESSRHPEGSKVQKR